MRKAETQNWIINLEDVVTQLDTVTVKFVCTKYGASDIYELSPCNYRKAWNELYYYAVGNNAT